MKSADEQLAALTWCADRVISEAELRERLARGAPLRVKLGLDPGAEHVTLGWSVPLRRLRLFQDLGHVAVLIVGDFTARIGDPSGQNKTRPMRSKEEVDAFAERVLAQFRLILDAERLEIHRNSEWLDELGVEGVLRLASSYTVARMLERDDFAKRHAAGQPISVIELLYPLMQAYDSVAVRADVELGGSDQLFTLVTARDVQRAYGQAPQVVLTMPLIEGTDGVEKMSQSKGNYIGITQAPEEQFGKLMSLPDHLMPKYFRLVTGVPPTEIDQIEGDLASGALRPEVAKRALAESVVTLYHGPAAAHAARERFDAIHRDHKIPDDAKEVSIPPECVEDGMVNLPRLLRCVGLAPSSRDAQRVIRDRGLRINGRVVESERVAVDELRGRVLQRGTRQFRKIT